MRYRPPIGSTPRARRLRNNPTDAERALWRMLRSCFPEWRFRRQVPIRDFIVDFCSHSARLVIEVDGGHHGGGGDAARSRMIEAEGYRLIRFWNNEVLGNPEGVAAAIAAALHGLHPHPTMVRHQGLFRGNKPGTPSHQGGGSQRPDLGEKQWHG